MGIPPHQHDVQRGQGKQRVQHLALRHVPDAHPLCASNLPTQRLQDAQQAAQQRGLARTVRTYQSEEVTSVDVQPHILQHYLLTVAQLYIVELNERFMGHVHLASASAAAMRFTMASIMLK